MHLWKLSGKALESSLEGVLKEVMGMAMHVPGKMRRIAPSLKKRSAKSLAIAVHTIQEGIYLAVCEGERHRINDILAPPRDHPTHGALQRDCTEIPAWV